MADQTLSPIMVRDLVWERMGLLFPVDDLIALYRHYGMDQDVWLRAKDIAAREKRSEMWARTRMNVGDFGVTKRAGKRILEVRESGYLAWLQSKMHPASRRENAA